MARFIDHDDDVAAMEDSIMAEVDFDEEVVLEEEVSDDLDEGLHEDEELEIRI